MTRKLTSLLCGLIGWITAVALTPQLLLCHFAPRPHRCDAGAERWQEQDDAFWDSVLRRLI